MIFDVICLKGYEAIWLLRLLRLFYIIEVHAIAYEQLPRVWERFRFQHRLLV